MTRDHGTQTELFETLGKCSKAEAIRLSRPVFERFDRWLRAAQAEIDGTTTTLSDAQVGGLVGQWLKEQEQANAINLQGNPKQHAETAEWLGDALSGQGSLKDLLAATDEAIAALLADEGVTVDHDSRVTLARRLAAVQFEFHKAMIPRFQTGEWSPRLTSAAFPALQRTRAAVSFDLLLDGWGADKGLSREALPKQMAFYERERTMARLAEFLGHKDAARVTKADAVRWKESLQAANKAPATVVNDIGEMSGVWGWAVRNGKVAENPFAGVAPAKSKKPTTRKGSFTPEQVSKILLAARNEAGALRWLPWVCAFTGARLNEVCQSQKEDIATLGGVTCLKIHDDGEGRSVKNEDSKRDVPLHSGLIAEGFLAYVEGLPAGSALFPDLPPDRFGRRSATGGKRVSRFLKRLGIDEPHISPSHSWRHTFIDRCKAVVMPLEVRSALTGHSAAMDESARYGSGMKSFHQVLKDHLENVIIVSGLI